MTASPETVAYLKQDYYLAADHDRTDLQPAPAADARGRHGRASAAVAKIIGLILDYQKTGRFPGFEPTPEAQLAAAELIAQYTNQEENR